MPLFWFLDLFVVVLAAGGALRFAHVAVVPQNHFGCRLHSFASLEGC